MNHKLAKGMKVKNENGNTTISLFSMNGLEILRQERRGKLKSMLMERFNGILFHKSGPASKRNTNNHVLEYWLSNVISLGSILNYIIDFPRPIS